MSESTQVSQVRPELVRGGSDESEDALTVTSRLFFIVDPRVHQAATKTNVRLVLPDPSESRVKTLQSAEQPCLLFPTRRSTCDRLVAVFFEMYDSHLDLVYRPEFQAKVRLPSLCPHHTFA